MFVKIKNNTIQQYPYTLDQLRLDNPATSFPKEPSKEVRESYGIFDVNLQDVPEFDPLTQRIETSAAPSFIGDKWVLTRKIEEQTSQQIVDNLANKSAQVRALRNKRLVASDWTQIADAPIDKDLWAKYRQALRDVTEQSGFPWSVEWPVAP